MGATWLVVIAIVVAFAMLVAFGCAAYYLYKHRPEPDNDRYFWDE